MKNQNTIRETQEILRRGYYKFDQKKVDLSLCTGIYDFEQAELYTKSRQKEIFEDRDNFMSKQFYPPWQHDILVCKGASFELAKKYYRPLILNTANAIIPAGKKTESMDTEEIRLCRATSLYCSLNSQNASQMYSVNDSNMSELLSDSMVLSPMVAVLRNRKMELIPDPYPVAILSVMPVELTNHVQIMNSSAVDAVMKSRLRNFFLIAARNMYRNIILTPFGCEEYGHKPENIAQYIKEILYEEEHIEFFEHIIIAIDCEAPSRYLEIFAQCLEDSTMIAQKDVEAGCFMYASKGGHLEGITENPNGETIKVRAYEVETIEFPDYIQGRYPIPVCNYITKTRTMIQNLGYAQAMLRNGIPLVAELIRDGENNKVTVIFVLPYMEIMHQIQETTDNSGEQHDSRNIVFHSKKYTQIQGVLCNQMEKLPEKVELSRIYSYLSYLTNTNLLRIQKTDIEGFSYVLYDRAGHKVVAIGLTLVSYHQVNAIVTLKFNPFVST